MDYIKKIRDKICFSLYYNKRFLEHSIRYNKNEFCWDIFIVNILHLKFHN